MLFPSVFKLVNKLKFTFLNAVFFSVVPEYTELSLQTVL